MTAGTWHLWDEEADSDVESDGRIVSTYSQTLFYKPVALTRPTAAYIAADIGVLPGSPFVNDTNATCSQMSIRNGPIKTIAPYLAYLVTFHWSTNATLPAANSTDPTTRRVIWYARANTQQRFVTRYPSATAALSSSSSSSAAPAWEVIVNTAGQPPDGGIPVDARIGQLRATRNVAASGYNLNVVNSYNGAINSDTWHGNKPGTVQVDVESQEVFEGAYHYFAESWTFTIDPTGMQPTFMSAGFFRRAPPIAGSSSSSTLSSQLIRILNSDLSGISTDTDPVQEPEPLDVNGQLVPIGSRPAGCAEVVVPYFLTLPFGSTFGL